MAVKVKLNRASIRLDQSIVRQIDGKVKNTKAIVRAVQRSGLPDRWAAATQDHLRRLHAALMYVFEGHVGGITGSVQSLQGVNLAKPWAPLAEDYIKRKITGSFWYETGDLLNYVAKGLAPLSGRGAVRKVETKAGKVPRGAKSVRVSVLVTPARLPEPLQSLVIYPFLQGKGNDTTGIGSEDDIQAYKLLVNQAVRGFVPEISAEFGKQLLDALKT